MAGGALTWAFPKPGPTAAATISVADNREYLDHRCPGARRNACALNSPPRSHGTRSFPQTPKRTSTTTSTADMVFPKLHCSRPAALFAPEASPPGPGLEPTPALRALRTTTRPLLSMTYNRLIAVVPAKPRFCTIRWVLHWEFSALPYDRGQIKNPGTKF